MIEEALVSDEVAKLLREKGFEGECRKNGDVSKPTQAVAMRWLRDDKNIFIQITRFGKEYIISLWNDDTYIDNVYEDIFFETYELAVGFGLYYVLTEVL